MFRRLSSSSSLSLSCSALKMGMLGGCSRHFLPQEQQHQQKRSITGDKIRAGQILIIDSKPWRVSQAAKSQKGQMGASYKIKLKQVGGEKTKDLTAQVSTDVPEAKYERLKLLFSGFDEEDQACFVYPQHHAKAGEEINLPATSLSQLHQDFLSVGMPADLLHIFGDEDGEIATGMAKDFYGELTIPTNYVYTVESIKMKAMMRTAVLVEADGAVAVTDVVQPSDKIKITIKEKEKTASFGGKAE